MRVRILAAIGIAAYAVCLVATVPASLLAARVADATGGAVELAETQGTLWSGSARALVHAGGARIAIDRVEWRFAPLQLAAGRLACDAIVAAQGIDAKLTVGRSPSRWVVAAAAARIDAALASAWFPLLGPAHPEGTLGITSSGLQVSGDGTARGALRVEWKDAAVAYSDVKPLGSYSLDATAEDGPARFVVATSGGPLRISGNGIFAPPSEIAFSGEARAEGADARALEPLLDLMGPRRPDGARSLELRGHL